MKPRFHCLALFKFAKLLIIHLLDKKDNLKLQQKQDFEWIFASKNYNNLK